MRVELNAMGLPTDPNVERIAFAIGPKLEDFMPSQRLSSQTLYKVIELDLFGPDPVSGVNAATEQQMRSALATAYNAVLQDSRNASWAHGPASGETNPAPAGNASGTVAQPPSTDTPLNPGDVEIDRS